jgi:formate-dependent nitrite reductase membrane component NrfD
LVGAAQWLVTGVVAVGVGWLLTGWVLGLVAVPVTHPRVGAAPVPVLLVAGGLTAGLALAVLAHLLARWAARQERIRTAGRFRGAVAEVARQLVVEPVREVLRAYREARSALHAAGAGRR